MPLCQGSREIYFLIFDFGRKRLRKAEVLTKVTIRCPIQSKREKSLIINPHNRIHGQNCTHATSVTWPWATSGSLRFFTGLIPTDDTWSSYCDPGPWGMLDVP